MGQIENYNQDEEVTPYGAIVIAILAVLYDISPIDIIADISVVGWIDDATITIGAFSNLAEKYFQEMSGFFKAIKWISIILEGLLIVLILLLGAAIIALFK